MHFNILFSIFLVVVLTVTQFAEAGTHPTVASGTHQAGAHSDQNPLLISFTAFEQLASELALKVNLFREVWIEQPNAEFFGGTSRDFLYWLKGKLAQARSEKQLEQIVAKLRAVPVIDVREFILYESDVDVISQNYVGISGQRYGIKKIDAISIDRIDPRTEAGADEIKQGYIPAEKIRLSKHGIKKNLPFGDGVREVYDGKPTIHFASESDFNSTRFAKLKINHPILLALRYIRILAMNYYQTYGREYPDHNRLFEMIDGDSERALREVIDHSLASGDLRANLANEKFRIWINAAIQKAFRSYTNPTAAKMLMEHFGADRLMSTYEGLEPINQYLFRQPRDPSVIEANLRRFRVDPRRLFIPLHEMFPDGKLYHGTRTEVAFRSILFQGVLPSEVGNAGPGLYGVAQPDISFSEKWGGDPDRLLVFDLDPATKIVDIRKDYGAQLLASYQKKYPNSSLEEFAEAFGIDIFCYNYDVQAFVVKNGGVLSKVNGHTRKLMKFADLLETIKAREQQDLHQLIRLIFDNGLNAYEVGVVTQIPEVRNLLETIRSRDFRQTANDPQIKGMLKDGIEIFVIPHFKEAFVRSIGELTIAQLADPNDLISSMLVSFDKSRNNDRETIDGLRALFISKIPTLFESASVADIEKVFLESDRNKSTLGFYASLYELLRRINSQATDRVRFMFMNLMPSGRHRTVNYESAVFDPVANLSVVARESSHPFDLETWRKWALQQEGRSDLQINVLQKLWEHFGFETEGNDDFLKEYTKIKNGVPSLLRIFSELTGYQRPNSKKIFPERWVLFDEIAENFIFESGNTETKAEKLKSAWLVYPWLQRALRLNPSHVRPETLVAAYDVVGRPQSLNGPDSWIHHFQIHETVIQFPQLAKHPRGAAIFEEALSHPKIVNSQSLDWALEKGIDTTWRHHPRAEYWKRALRLERENRFKNPDIVTREEFLANPEVLKTKLSGSHCGSDIKL